MSKDLKALDELKFDIRIVEHKFRRGEIDRKEYEAYLKKLPDDGDKCEYIDVYTEPQDELTPFAEGLTFTSA